MPILWTTAVWTITFIEDLGHLGQRSQPEGNRIKMKLVSLLPSQDLLNTMQRLDRCIRRRFLVDFPAEYASRSQHRFPILLAAGWNFYHAMGNESFRRQKWSEDKGGRSISRSPRFRLRRHLLKRCPAEWESFEEPSPVLRADKLD